MSHSPLIVYLDSSDYSRLSDPKRSNNSDNKYVKEYLLQKISTREIDIRYSMAHIIEACHRDKNSKNLAALRAASISELSGRRVLKYFGRIITEEIEYIHNENDTRPNPTSDHGEWFPSLPGFGKDLQDALTEGTSEALNKVPQNRKQRRILRSIYGDPKRPRPQAIKKLIDDPEHIARLCAEYGFSDRFVQNRLFEKISANQDNHEEIEELVFEEIFEPTRFIPNYVDRFDKDKKVKGSLITLGDRLVENAKKAQLRIRTLVVDEVAKMSKFNSRVEWQKTMLESESLLYHSILAAILQSENQKRSDTTATIIEPLHRKNDQLPGLSCLVRAVLEWQFDCVGNLSNLRSPIPSDAGDLFHIFYLPYVDVWRGDGYSSELASRTWANHKQKIANSFNKLPEIIESALKTNRTKDFQQ